MVGGQFEVERNETQNHLRIHRVNEIVKGIPKEQVRILDWGCGHGYLINDLKKAGYIHVEGYDPYTEEFDILPKPNCYHVVCMVECVEHTSAPFVEIDAIKRCLVSGGIVMIETGFTDVAKEDGIAIENYFYISAVDGHSTIFSHHSLDLLMALRGFIPRLHFDRHVRLFQKL